MNIKYVDSHCHLDMLAKQNNEPVTEIISRAAAQGVEHFLAVCVTLAEFESVRDIAQATSNVHCSLGLHPCYEVDAEPTTKDYLELYRENEQHVVAIGEAGLDYHYLGPGKGAQQERLVRQIEVARAVDLPIIIHTREAREDTVAILRESGEYALRGVIHCFTENWEMAKQCLDLGFYLSFSGILTFKSAEMLREVAKKAPLDRMLIETDSPYLAPVPYRGKTNEPAYVSYVAQCIAEQRGIAVEDVAHATTQNFYDLFSAIPKMASS